MATTYVIPKARLFRELGRVTNLHDSATRAGVAAEGFGRGRGEGEPGQRRSPARARKIVYAPGGRDRYRRRGYFWYAVELSSWACNLICLDRSPRITGAAFGTQGQSVFQRS